VRSVVVAGIGGLIIGHVLWLVGISLAIATSNVSTWVLVIAAMSLVAALVGGLLGRRFHRAKAYAKAWFAWCLPMPPVLLSIIVLGVTYL
jgi:hypothetical protein